jgi:hypothetical protein
MLKKWTLANFKSFKDRTELSLAPITVLAGANSSGKSTIIQSILLLKQTIEYIPESRAIGLNGPLLKLGRFDDIKNATSKELDIHFSWTLSNVSAYKAPAPYFDTYVYPYFGRNVALNNASFEISFAVDDESTSEVDHSTSRSSDELRQLHPVLRSSTCAIEYSLVDEPKESPKKVSVKIRRHHAKKDSAPIGNSTPTLSDMRQALPYSVENLDPAARRELIQDRPEAKVIGASARHFFPNQLGVVYNKNKNLARTVAALMSSIHYSPAMYDRDVAKAVIPAEWIRYVIDLIIESLSAVEKTSSIPAIVLTRAAQQFSDFTLRDFSYMELQDTLQIPFRRLDPRARSIVRSTLADHQEELEAKFLEISQLPEEVAFDLERHV